jgi:hypothetical protein
MFAGLRSKVTYANVASTIALFAAVGTGGAYAANTIGSSDIIDESILSQDVQNGQVTWDDLAQNAVTSSRIKDESVAGSDIINGTIGNVDLADGGVSQSKLANDSVGPAQIQTDAVNATEIADSSIDSGEIIDNSLFASDLAPGSVGASELAANATDGSKVLNNSLTTADVAGADVSGHVDLSGVANGRCTQVTLNVSGAKTGETAIVSTQAAIQNGILFYAQQVPSDGHVMANICNFTGTTMTAISNLPVRVVTFG